ncbi:MAG TPA: hypothetical protein VH186_27335 [Chloroflexia bacterium]|nr:hypothetical protein [Chloroflexia bacterium]
MIESLTPRAKTLLMAQPRNLKGQPATLAEIEDILEKYNFPKNHPVIPFQLELGGYHYFNRYGPAASKKLGIPIEPVVEWKGQKSFCECLIPGTAPCEVVMDETGQIYYNASDDYTVISYSSVLVQIEQDVLLDSLFDISPGWYYSVIEIPPEVKAALEEELTLAHFEPVLEAKDQFNSWLLSPDCQIKIARTWDTQKLKFSVFAYSTGEESLNQLDKIMQNKLDLKLKNPFYTIRYPHKQS